VQRIERRATVRADTSVVEDRENFVSPVLIYKERTYAKNEKVETCIYSSGTALIVAIAGGLLLRTRPRPTRPSRTATELKTLTQSSAAPGLLGEGYLAHAAGRQGAQSIDYQQLLADALGSRSRNSRPPTRQHARRRSSRP